MLYGAICIRIERPGFSSHEVRRHQGTAVMPACISSLRQVKQALQLEARHEDTSNSLHCKKQLTISIVDETVGSVMLAAWML